MTTKYRLIKVYWLSILIAAIFVLAGCSPAPGTPSTGQTPAAGDVTPEIPQTGGNLVEVQLEDFTINMPPSINAGQTLFEVTNAGMEEHSFKIEGQGVEAELEHHLQPGETLTLTVDLAPGIYDVYCPVDDHAVEGMRLDLTVSEP
jgi:uncharacterized cupredoxin-like copper-binding protein